MPELPEVETTARLIRPHLEGREIVGARASWARTLGGTSGAAFRRALCGARIAAVRRRGKHILLDLERAGSPAGAVAVHLRMTGRLYAEPGGTTPDEHVRVVVDLDDGRALHFLDVRKFGRFVFVRDPEAFLAHLGPEPLGPEFTPAWLHAALRGRKRALKPLLLDQGFLAGLGNIYVDEALYRTRLHPLRRSNTVRRPAATALHAAITGVLTVALEKQGASFDRFYRTPEGQPGSYQHEFQVYGKAGLPCPRCKTAIRRIVVGQRGTHLCPRCQRAPRLR